MYRCYHSGKIKQFLLLDSILLLLLWLTSSMIRHSMKSSGDYGGVFLPIVMYHSVTEYASTEYQITPNQFAQDLYYLYANGYKTVSVGDLLAYTEGKGELPEKPVMLTFDDGFYNNLSVVLPLLEEYDMCAVVSIVGNYTDNLAENDPHVEKYSYLTWEDIQILQKSGRIEIGSHTYNLHDNQQRAGCSILYGEDVQTYQIMLHNDLEQLQTRMLQETGKTSSIFAYPYGFVCKESIPVLKELGFICTFTCREQANYITQDADCLYNLDRYNRNPAESTEDFFSRILQG